ncbi:cobalt-precorrin-6A reductase [Diaphorobacter aerolatus]|uniref:Cobalt-precorrin-6A reductase n=1 Tax=Diaphorobacter aerolatus TaxID=1288495 RepID=A0A7H0GJF9_9BURK|nr:cobalt-precorrin-6A reductase [Diaphorobacter aerolatus]QNP48425.1 cobalt-precorrin-6A reductase [Diaphorobacter aerolatus]
MTSTLSHVLLLGGTFDAHVLSLQLQAAGIAATYSYAGATLNRRTSALPTRVGGFGGVEGLMRYLQEHRITHVIDATHPFAAQMSRHAIEACGALDIPLIAMERPVWQARPGDRWTHATDMSAAAALLPATARRVFLAIGRKQLAAFSQLAKRYRFILRVIDPQQTPLLADEHELIIARGPFALEDELALLQKHLVDCIVSKNAGGKDTYAKIEAARELQIPVIMVDRPSLPERALCETPEQAMEWLRTGIIAHAT